jgi:hypothetical protein
MVDLLATGGVVNILIILGIYVAQGQSGKISLRDLVTIDGVWIGNCNY